MSRLGRVNCRCATGLRSKLLIMWCMVSPTDARLQGTLIYFTILAVNLCSRVMQTMLLYWKLSDVMAPCSTCNDTLQGIKKTVSRLWELLGSGPAVVHLSYCKETGPCRQGDTMMHCRCCWGLHGRSVSAQDTVLAALASKSNHAFGNENNTYILYHICILRRVGCSDRRSYLAL